MQCRQRIDTTPSQRHSKGRMECRCIHFVYVVHDRSGRTVTPRTNLPRSKFPRKKGKVFRMIVYHFSVLLSFPSGIIGLSATFRATMSAKVKHSRPMLVLVHQKVLVCIVTFFSFTNRTGNLSLTNHVSRTLAAIIVADFRLPNLQRNIIWAIRLLGICIRLSGTIMCRFCTNNWEHRFSSLSPRAKTM